MLGRTKMLKQTTIPKDMKEHALSLIRDYQHYQIMLGAALVEYFLRKNGYSQPKRDINEEYQPCCYSIKFKSPETFEKHCKSIQHIANLFEVDETKLTEIIEKKGKENEG